MSNFANPRSTGKTNASTIRTRKRIHQAFLKLAEKTDFTDINVNMLTKAASLNRTTFYLHYQSLDDLIEEVTNDILNDLGEGGRLLAAGFGKQPPEANDSHFRTIGSRPKLFQRLFSSPGSGQLNARLMEMYVKATKGIWEQMGYDLTKNPESWELRARYTAGGYHAITLHWLETGMAESTESISGRALEFMQLIAEAERTMQSND